MFHEIENSRLFYILLYNDKNVSIRKELYYSVDTKIVISFKNTSMVLIIQYYFTNIFVLSICASDQKTF